MKTNSETVCDDNGYEILVGYDYEETAGYYEEENNIASWVEPTMYTELTSVEVIIRGRGIDILPQLTEKEKISIIQTLNYEPCLF